MLKSNSFYFSQLSMIFIKLIAAVHLSRIMSILYYD